MPGKKNGKGKVAKQLHEAKGLLEELRELAPDDGRGMERLLLEHVLKSAEKKGSSKSGGIDLSIVKLLLENRKQSGGGDAVMVAMIQGQQAAAAASQQMMMSFMTMMVKMMADRPDPGSAKIEQMGQLIALAKTLSGDDEPAWVKAIEPLADLAGVALEAKIEERKADAEAKG